MSLDYVRRTYGVPARRGGRVRYEYLSGVYRYGRIASATNLLRVRWEDDGTRANLHPTWRVTYCDDVEVTRG